MNIKIKKNKRIDESEVIDLEMIIGTKLPTSYRDFLIENNGGIPDENEFDIIECKNSSGVERFMSVGQIKSVKKRLKDRFPVNSLPIANTENGNYICIVTGENEGIYFWDHELEVYYSAWKNMIFLCKDFKDFLKMLRKFDISKIELMPGSVEIVWVDPDFKPKF